MFWSEMHRCIALTAGVVPRRSKTQGGSLVPGNSIVASCAAVKPCIQAGNSAAVRLNSIEAPLVSADRDTSG